MNAEEGFRTLGLEPGASPAEVRSAFRRLAKAYHPDAAPSRGADFQRVTAAYSLLRGLEQPQERKRTLSDWYRERRSRELHETDERERRVRLRVDGILDRYEEGVSRRLEQVEQDGDRRLIEGIVFRLGSDLPEVRRLALERVGPFVNRGEVRQALHGLLSQREVDEGTARLLAGLPMAAATRRRLAAGLSSRAAAFPNSLLSSLLGFPETDLSLMERYLAFASPAGVALILRHWPRDKALSDVTLRRLLEQEDPDALVPVLSMMKQHFSETAARHRKRLAELEGHPAPAVRVWSRALLPD